jgi:hypothetical protein
MATSTTSLELRKPAGGDTVNVATDLNANFDIIDGMHFKGSDIASASAVAVGNEEAGAYRDVTGTTGVTSIAARNAGQVVRLQFDGALTITHNGTSLIMPGASDYVTVAGDVLEFMSEGSGNWRYIGGSRQPIHLLDTVDLHLGTGDDAVARWSTGDASNHSLALGLGDSNQALHITDKAAVATDWNIAAGTHPTVYVHSNTTPATDYLKLGAHDGTTAYIDVVGGTTLRLAIAGTNEIDLTATAFSPATNDSNALGTTALRWSDLFVAAGGVLNFDAGNVTISHAAGKLTFGGSGSVEVDFNNHEMTNVDINSGAIDGTTIGAASAAVATVTTLNATTVSVTTITLNDVSLSRGATNRLDVATGDSLQMVDGTIDIGGLTSNTTLGKQLRFSTGSAYDRYASIQAYRGGDAATIDMVFNVWTGGSAIEGMRIFSNGGLVVGSPTGSTKGAGTINATAVYDDDTLLTDYVFAEDYRLIPIPEMREFYEAKGHLPTIPGRDEWEATGQFSLGKMATRLWETVEVHARYIAELEHEIALLRGP